MYKRQVEQLGRGAVDTAVVLCPPRDSAAGQAALLERRQIARTPLGRQPFALTVAREHPLAEGPLTPERLLEYPCIPVSYTHLDVYKRQLHILGHVVVQHVGDV